MTHMKGWLAIGCLLSLATTGLALSKPKDPMNIREGCLDEIHLKVATLKGGVAVVIRPFSTDGVDRGTGGDDAKNEKRTEAVAEVFGGDYVKFLSDDTRDVGHDIATFLGRWAAGEGLQKD